MSDLEQLKGEVATSTSFEKTVQTILDKILNPELRDKFAKKYLIVQQQKEYVAGRLSGEKSETHILTESLQEEVKMLEKLLPLQSANSGFEIFVSFFSSLDSESKEKMLLLFDEEPADVLDYFKKNGFPVNAETLNLFNNHFKLQLKQKTDNSIIDNEIEKEYNNFLKITGKFLEKKGDIESAGFGVLFSVLNQIDSIDLPLPQKKLLKVRALFGSASDQGIKDLNIKVGGGVLEGGYLNTLSSEKFEQFLKLIQTIDRDGGKTGTESLFQQISTLAIKYSPEISAKITLFLDKNTITQPPPDNLQQAQIRATLGGENFTQVGNRFEATTSNGIVAYNPRTGERTLRSSRESSYELRTEISLGDFYPETVKYEKARQELEPKINRNKSIIQILENIKGLYDNTPIAELEKSFRSIFKEHFYSMYSSFKKTFFEVTGKNMSEIKTISEIKSDLVRVLAVLKEELTKSENELLLSKQNYQVALETYMKAYKEKLKAKDARLKEVLSFFHSIGFDILPKSITDMIIELVNAKIPGEIAGIKFDTDINIKEGILGLRDRSAGKELFIQFFHKILGGDEKHPLFKTNGVGKIIGVYVDNESRSDDVSGKIKDLVRNIGRNFTLETAKSNLGL